MASSHYKADEAKKVNKWVDFNKEENSLTIKAIALDVIWGSDARYWTIPSDPEKPLELRQVAWLEVTYSASIKNLRLQPGKYKVNFMVSMKSEADFGWSGCPVYLMARVGENKPIWKSADLSLLAKGREAAATKTLIPAKPLNFTITDKDANLSLGLYEIWKGGWKGGLLIHQVNITRVD